MDDVLPILLAHPCLHTPQLLCKLLATSKQLGALVHATCGGVLSVAWRLEQDFTAGVAPPAEAAWAAKHAVLLGEVECLSWTNDNVLAVTDALARQHQQGLQLRAWRSWSMHARALAALPPSLTSLEIWGDSIVSEPGDGSGGAGGASEQDGDAALAAALAGRLTRLRRLQLPWSAMQRSDSPLQPALEQLSGSLSSIRLSPPRSSSLEYACLPASLRHLELNRSGDSSEPPLALRHLTALSSLVLQRALAGADVLPAASLIDIAAVWQQTSMEPLTALSGLTRLVLRQCTAPAEQLRKLSALERLADVSLQFQASSPSEDAGNALADASAAFGVLPLRELHIYTQDVTAAALQHIRACKHITVLAMHACTVEASLEQLAAALAQLPALQELVLGVPTTFSGGGGGGSGEAAAAAAAAGSGEGGAVAAAAVPAWPQLQRCSLAFMGVQQLQVVFGPLLASPQLTALCLDSMKSGGDDAAAVIAACTTGLRCLSLVDNPVGLSITDALLATIAARLAQLTRLSLDQCLGVTDAGVQSLASLRQLRELVVDKQCKRVSTAAKRQALGIAW